MDESMTTGTWHEGKVDPSQDHFKLYFFEDPGAKGATPFPPPVAFVGRDGHQSVVVQFEHENPASAKAKASVENALKTLVTDHSGPTWEYLRSWAGGFGNMYADVHWSYFLGEETDHQQGGATRRTT